tara:strand:- start:157 stop:1497 length:1341 start_codon:yes stop_codon:yes gene_type:complete
MMRLISVLGETLVVRSAVLRVGVVAGLICAFGLAVVPRVEAAVYEFDEVFNFLQVLSASQSGQAAGASLLFGAVCAVPTGQDCNDPAVSHAGTSAFATQDGLQASLSQFSLTAAPNFWSRRFATSVQSPGPTNSWTLKFNNGGDTTTVETPDLQGLTVIPFANSVTISGGSAQPTIAWTLPTGANVQAARVNVHRLDTRVEGGIADIVLAQDLPISQTSFQIPDGTLDPNGTYEFEISLLQTRDGTGDASQSNILSRSRGFFGFTPPNDGFPAKVYLPTVQDHPTQPGASVYTFDIQDIQADETIFIDPLVAVGYDYEIGSSDANFASVLLPHIGDDQFELWLFDASDIAFNTGRILTAGVAFDFLSEIDPLGVGKFRILGIETDANLDPGDPTAFITGLSFVGGSSFTGSMTALVQEVPEPWMLPVFTLGIAGLGAARYRRRSIP